MALAAPAPTTASRLPLQPPARHEKIAKTKPESSGKNLVELVDVSAVTVDEPEKAIRSFEASKPEKKLKCDVLIIGGGVGGISAARKIWELTGEGKNGRLAGKPASVIITEETDWLGGQMTAQGVPALDENYLVDTTGSTLSYQRLRTAIRDYYKKNTKLVADSLDDPYFNPGNCWVSFLAFEPIVALAQINQLLKPAIEAKHLQVFYRCKPFRVHREEHGAKRITSVDFADFASGKTFSVEPKICLDATELGDVLALGKYDYASGSDSRASTGEPHAPEIGDKENVQDFTYPFVIELRPGTKNQIEKPSLFDEFKNQNKFSFLGYKMFVPVKKKDMEGSYLPFWEYRRLIDSANFADPNYANDIAVINWDSNDLRAFNIIDQTAKTQVEHLAKGKLVSLGFLYWLQHEAPRDDGGKGYPELTLRCDMLGTTDGLAKFPYIRESRRAKTLKTIVEQDIVSSFNTGARAKAFEDSVGIGFYPVDIHGRQEIPGAGQQTRPFQIPLAALVPSQGANLLPACKNIGTTHITNGAYRLHPIEWAIGEAQGALAASALARKSTPFEISQSEKQYRSLQKLLVESGVPIYWYDDVPTDHKNFPAIQYLSALGLMTGSTESLQFLPDEKITRAELAQSLEKICLDEPIKASGKKSQSSAKIGDLPADAEQANALAKCVQAAFFHVDESGQVHPQAIVTIEDLRKIAQSKVIEAKSEKRLTKWQQDNEKEFVVHNDVTRGQAAQWLYILAEPDK